MNKKKNIKVKYFKQFIFLLSFFIFSDDILFSQNLAQNLALDKDSVFVIQDPKGGYHLYIKAKPDIKSVLLTETTKDPNLKLANYSYRDPNFNEINGNEKRLLDGEFLSPEKKLYSLIDSTVEENTPIGKAFHIWIPYIIIYGYDWSRAGEIEVQDGTFFNIRTFEKPYGDYTGEFKDNPFMLRVTQKPVEEKPKNEALEVYSDDAVKAFSDIANITEGKILYAKNTEGLLPTIKEIIKKNKNEKIDLLFAIDSTESMKDDIKFLRANIMNLLNEILPEYESFRIGLVLYKDYRDDFLVKEACVFTDDLKKFEKALFRFKVFGGRDIPEAVYEGLHLGLLQSWRAVDNSTDKKLILIGDAPPHSRPRGKIKKETIDKLAAKKSVSVYPIILPHGLAY